jgi:hypothetical protein
LRTDLRQRNGIAYRIEANVNRLAPAEHEPVEARSSCATALDMGTTQDNDRHNPGAVMDIGGWLKGLDLERYEGAFRDNEFLV